MTERENKQERIKRNSMKKYRKLQKKKESKY